MPHYNTIIAARDTKYRIRNNKKIIKKIRHSIKKDDNDAIYGLESFDHKINDLHDSIEKTESIEKTDNIEKAESTEKTDSKEKTDSIKNQTAQKESITKND